MVMPRQKSGKTIARLSVYRRVLMGLRTQGIVNAFSHQLAKASGVTAVQVRRDLMAVGSAGNPTRGYDVENLVRNIGSFLGSLETQSVALVGAGNVGRAILAYLAGRRPNLKLVACFDSDPAKIGRVINGCRCYGIESLREVLNDEEVATAVVAVPDDQAQDITDALVAAGVRGILNFAPVHLRVPPAVYVEDVDIATLLEKVVFFSRQQKKTG